MKKHAWFFLSLCLTMHAVAASSDDLPPDSVIMHKTNELVMKFLDSYTLSDINGNYSRLGDSLFITLFSEQASMYNFFPGTMNYRRNIPVDSYQNIIRRLYKDMIIQPGIADYSIEVTADSRDEGFMFYRAEIMTDVILFSNRFDRIADIDLHLYISIEADLVKNTYSITQVTDASPALVDLAFRFLDTNRDPLRALPVVFSYYADSKKNELSRLRHTDSNGWVKFSYVPADKILGITLPHGYSLLLDNNLTARQWHSIPTTERLMFVNQGLDFITNKFFAEAGFSRHAFMHNSLNQQGFDFVNFNQDFDFQTENSFYFDIAYNIFQKNRHQILIGSGIEYFNASFQMSTDSVAQVFPSLFDQDDSKFSLVIRANDILESYTFQSYALPFFITYRYQTRNRHIPAIDLSAKGLYFFSEKLSYDVMLTEETLCIYEQNSLTVKQLGQYDDQANVFSENNSLRGELDNSQRVALSAHLAVNITLVEGYLWLQPRVMYHFFQFGNKQNSYQNPNNNSSNAYYYNPSFSYSSYYKGFVNYGLGLLIGL